MSKQEVRVDTSLIPDHVKDSLGRAALDVVEKAFQRPGAEEEYQAWLSERLKSKRDTKIGG